MHRKIIAFVTGPIYSASVCETRGNGSRNVTDAPVELIHVLAVASI